MKHTSKSSLLQECTFNKKRSSTSLLVSVKTIGRLWYCKPCCARWFVTFDGQECSSPAQIDQIMTNYEIDDKSWSPFTFRGICRINRSGNIKVALRLGPCNGTGNGIKKESKDPDTGEKVVTNSIIIEEVENFRWIHV